VLTDFGISRTALIAGPGTAADDVFMLGATAFFAATGRSPWGDHSAATDPAIPSAAPALPGDSDLAGCPSWLVPIVLACLAADPAARPAAAELHAWLTDEIGQQPRSWLPEPVAVRVAEYQALPPSRGRFRWSRGREQREQ
jgi:eukaryotic-like serine/threonine-protein kinase